MLRALSIIFAVSITWTFAFEESNKNILPWSSPSVKLRPHHWRLQQPNLSPIFQKLLESRRQTNVEDDFLRWRGVQKRNPTGQEMSSLSVTNGMEILRQKLLRELIRRNSVTTNGRGSRTNADEILTIIG